MIEQEKNSEINTKLNDISVSDVLIDIYKKEKSVNKNNKNALWYSQSFTFLMTCIPFLLSTKIEPEFSFIILMLFIGSCFGMITGAMVERPFKWMKNLLMKNKNYAKKEKDFKMINLALEQLIEKEDFQFNYLANIDIVLNKCGKADDITESISQKVKVIKEKKKHLINSFQIGNIVNSIGWIKDIEIEMYHLKNLTHQFDTLATNNENYIKKYEEFLNKNSLNDLIQEKIQKIEINDFKKLI